MYKLGRWLEQMAAEHPLTLASVICVLLFMLAGGVALHSEDKAAVTAALVEQEKKNKAIAEQAAAAAAAAREAAKTPEQRAREAAEEKAAQAAAAKAAADLAKREAAIDKAGVGLEHLPWYQLCQRWGQERRRQMGSPAEEAVYRALTNQRLINAKDNRAIAMRVQLPEIGMTGCGAIAVLGPNYQQNAHTSTYGTRVQIVYRDRGIYVYTEGPTGDHNGIVTSISY